MKGADSGVSFTANKQILKDYQIYNNLGAYNSNGENSTGCTFSSSSSCFGGIFHSVGANSSDYVYVRKSISAYCYVTHVGDSSCAI